MPWRGGESMSDSILSTDRLRDLVAKFADCRIAVIGDFFLDKYLEVDPALAEPSIETGKTAHQVVAVRTAPGAAGTVVSNLAALGTGEIHAIGFCGDDGEGYELRKGLTARRCSVGHLHICGSIHTPTYLKPVDTGRRVLSAEHSRYDTKNRVKTPSLLEDLVLDSLDALLPKIDGVLVLDQVTETDCGVITARVREAIAEQANRYGKVLFWADSRCLIRKFRNVIIKANEFEVAEIPLGRMSESIPLEAVRHAAELMRQVSGRTVFVTRGAQGMLVTDPEWTSVPAVRIDNDIDPTGAGDSVSAGAFLTLCAGGTPPEAAVVGNLVASLTVQQIGTTGTAHPDQLVPQLTLWRQQQGLDK